MKLVHSILVTGASGVGKSTLIRGALEHFGSGAVLLAPGEEGDSYIGLDDAIRFAFKPVGDPFFQPELGEFTVSGHRDAITWLRAIYTAVSDDIKSNKPPRYAVLGCDTITQLARLGYNVALAKFRRTEPPPAQSPDGAAFYGYLRMVLESQMRIMSAIRGLGVHLIVAAHPKETEVSEMLKTQADPSSKKVIPDIPGGFKDQLPSFFSNVLQMGIMNGKPGERIHFIQWRSDPKRVTKSRFGELDKNEVFRADWTKLNERIQQRVETLTKEGL